jgi:hypothetical protein
LELLMEEKNEKLSMWARLYKRWGQLDADPRKAPADGEAETGISAMEVELRALRAKADVASPDGSAPGSR